MTTAEFEASNCIRWSGLFTRRGYGRARKSDGAKYYGEPAHRVVWRAVNGEIPTGYHVDHICFNAACVNVDHLRLLIASENCAAQRSAFADRCVNGHLFNEANTYLRRTSLDGRRSCRICNAAASRRYRLRKRGA